MSEKDEGWYGVGYLVMRFSLICSRVSLFSRTYHSETSILLSDVGEWYRSDPFYSFYWRRRRGNQWPTTRPRATLTVELVDGRRGASRSCKDGRTYSALRLRKPGAFSTHSNSNSLQTHDLLYSE